MLGKFGFIRNRVRWRWQIFMLLAIAALAAFILIPRFITQAQTPPVTRATVVDIVGQQLLIQNRQARPSDTARLGEQVRTTQARSQLNFNSGAIGRLGEKTVLTIGLRCFQIQRGQILVKGAVNGCTNTVRAGVRGTSYWIEVNEQGRSEVGVLEGEVQLTPLKQTNQKPVTLIQGQGIIIAPNGRFGSVTQWPFKRFDGILKGELFEGFNTEFPGLLDVKEALEQEFPGQQFSNEAS